MKFIKKGIFSVIALVSYGQVVATDVFLLNKTTKPVSYDLEYYTFEQDALKAVGSVTPFVAISGAIDKKKAEEYRKKMDWSHAKGDLAPNASVQVKSYRVYRLTVRPTQDATSRIVSIQGDKRIFAACQNRKSKECVGSTLKDIGSVLAGTELIFNQTGLSNIARPVVLVITQDPEMEKRGEVGYILTELPHTWDIFKRRTPTGFFYELQGMSTLPNVPAR